MATLTQSNKKIRVINRRQRPKATCHPTAMHHALGLCKRCYQREQRYGRYPSAKPATCHPDRVARARGLCASCHAGYLRDVSELAQKKIASRMVDYVIRKKRENPFFLRERAWRLKYGITADDYMRLYTEQQGRCAVCKTYRDMELETKILQVDHCHKTNTIRGLLCGDCNKGIGTFKEQSDRLRAAADYVDYHRRRMARRAS